MLRKTDFGQAYSDFLFELGRAKKDKNELINMLDAADVKLNIALEEARKYEQGVNKFYLCCNKYNYTAQKFYEKMGGTIIGEDMDNEESWMNSGK